MSNKEIGTVLFDQKTLEKRAYEIGKQITEDYKDSDKEVIFIGILRGAVMWMTDVLKNVDLPCTIDFMACSSYGSSTKTSGVVKINKDLDSDIKGKHVIIVEDIVDSGITLSYLKSYLANHNPESIKICSLLDKKAGRRCEIEADYVGFEVDDLFIVGYGLDYNQKYRNLPYISYLTEE